MSRPEKNASAGIHTWPIFLVVLVVLFVIFAMYGKKTDNPLFSIGVEQTDIPEDAENVQEGPFNTYFYTVDPSDE